MEKISQPPPDEEFLKRIANLEHLSMSDNTLTPERLRRVAEYMGYETIHIQKGIVEIYDGDFEEWVRYTGTTPEQSMELLKMLLKELDLEAWANLYMSKVKGQPFEQAILLAAWEYIKDTSHE